MSRGRGGNYKDSQRFSLPFRKGQSQFYSSTATGQPRGPRVPSPSSLSGSSPHPSFYSYSSVPGVPPRDHPFPPRHSDLPLLASPQHGSDQNFDSNGVSFRQNQVQFLRGQSAQAPQFKAPQQRGSQTYNRGEEVSTEPIQYQPGYRDFKTNSYSFGRRDCYSRGQDNWQGEQNFGPKRRSGWNHPHQKGQYYSNQHTNHFWNAQANDLSSGLHNLSFGDRVKRLDTSDTLSCSSSASKVSSFPSSFRESLYWTPENHQQVCTFLTSLRPDESVQAKVLGKKLGLPKKIVNKVLYDLLKSNQVVKQGETPPLWRLRKDEDREPIKEKDQTQSSKGLDKEPVQSPCINQNAIGDFTSTSTPSPSKILIEADSDTSEQSEESDGDDTCEKLLADQDKKTLSPTVQSVTLSTMADSKDSKEKILQYLYEAGTGNALVIAKNLGLRSAKQVNPTLYALEKQGDVKRNTDVTPPTWELSAHRQEKMDRQRKAAATANQDVNSAATTIKLEAKQIANVGLVKFEADDGFGFPCNTAAEPLEGGENPLVEMLDNDNVFGNTEVDIPGFDLVSKPSDLSSSTHRNFQPPPHQFSYYQGTASNGGEQSQWASDDIPEFLNTIRSEVAVSLAAPPPPAQSMESSRLQKLKEARSKNPVSGLMEFAQHLGYTCEFLLLDQSGPSHDPRLVVGKVSL